MVLLLLQDAAFGISFLLFVFFYLFIILIGLASLALSLFLVYWTYKDAKQRGMSDPELWALMVFFGSFAGFVAYLVFRE